jgi:hypothetical protein
MEIFLYFLGVIGMTHIIVDATIFKPVRDWFDRRLPTQVASLIHCYQCSGFWCGMLCGYFAFPNITWLQIFLAGCAGSFLSNIAAIYLNYLEAQTVISLNDEGK